MIVYSIACRHSHLCIQFHTLDSGQSLRHIFGFVVYIVFHRLFPFPPRRSVSHLGIRELSRWVYWIRGIEVVSLFWTRDQYMHHREANIDPWVPKYKSFLDVWKRHAHMNSTFYVFSLVWVNKQLMIEHFPVYIDTFNVHREVNFDPWILSTKAFLMCVSFLRSYIHTSKHSLNVWIRHTHMSSRF